MLICEDDIGPLGMMSHYECFGDDPRSVLLVVTDYMEEWELGAESRADFWVRVEGFIKQRRSGEIKGESPSICLVPTLRRREMK